jgi:copper ion binding protein
MKHVLRSFVWLGISVVVLTSAAKAQESKQHHSPAAYAAEMNKKFADPQADIREYVKRFENDSRDVFAKRYEIARAVGLKPGSAVADIGACTGLYTFLFAEEIKPTGTVYAVDIGPAFVKYIAERAKELGYERIVKTVLNTQDSAELPADSIDVAFLCDTYHHFDHPEKMLASIHRALRPGGRMIIIDFDLRSDSGEYVKQRARAAKEVYFKEIASAGFQRTETKQAPSFASNFYAEFRRVDVKPSVARAAGVKKVEFSVEGMRCERCASKITAALGAISGVKSVEVSLEAKKATVEADLALVSIAKIEKTVEDAGFMAKAIAAGSSEK